MGKKLTTEEFIAKAREVHGNKYDYSKVNYVNNKTDVTIICPKHGEFQRQPSAHISDKQGCKYCGIESRAMKQRMSTEEFIAKAREVHGDKYDYSKVEYVKNAIPVTIICPKHGEFPQTPHDHLGGAGCTICGGRSVYTTESFIAKAREVHGDKYDYSKTVYRRNDDDIIVICPEHGEFPTTPHRHIKNLAGCPECAGVKRYTNARFISKAREIYGDRYEYPNLSFENNKSTIQIVCPDHGPFPRRVFDHIIMKKGCPVCSGRTTAFTTAYYTDKALEILTRSDIRSLSNLAIMGILDQAGSSIIKDVCKILAKTEPDTPAREKAIKTAIKDIKSAQQNNSTEEELASVLEKEAESIKVSDDTEVLASTTELQKKSTNTPRAVDSISALEIFDELTRQSDNGSALNKNDEDESFDTSAIDQVLVNEVLGEVMVKINIAMMRNRLEEEVEAIRNYKGNGLAMYVRFRFLEMYAEINAITETADYIAPNPINFMQKFFVWKMRQTNTFLNWSGTGCGKTRAALACMADSNAHVSLVVVPNAIIGSRSFRNELIRVYGNAYDLVIPEQAYEIDTDYAERSRPTIILINYDKFSCASADKFVSRIAENHIDFINLDEVHMIKRRYEGMSSIRSSKVADLLCILRGNNPDIKVLAQTATPFINNINEFRSIIETVYCEKIENMKNRFSYASIANAHRAYVLYGYGLTYETGIKVNERTIGLKLSEKSAIASEVMDIKEDSENHSKRSELAIATLNAKLEWIVKNVRKGDIIYTKFQTDIADKIAERLNDNGISAVVYNGTTKSERADGLCCFLNGDIDVLIGGDCLTTGIDGLQKVSNRIIFVGVPDTAKDYDQLVGRINRQGSNFNEVELVVLSVDIPGQKSEERKGMRRIERKSMYSKIIATGNFKDNADFTREMLEEEVYNYIENK